MERYQTGLSIQQAIGDKLDESATLNNISQIYDARGDYDTAFDYLKQSLAIRQEIGDKSGLCATLSNMGRLFWRSGEKHAVLDAAEPTQ